MEDSFYYQVYLEWRLEELLGAYELLFGPSKILPYFENSEAQINTYNEKPIRSSVYQYPMYFKNEIDSYIDELLVAGIIRPSKSSYDTNVWVIQGQPDHVGERKFKVVVNYKNLNAVTTADRYPIPEINYILAQLGQKKIFSVITLKDGFHQIRLRKTDIKKTAFTVHRGKYEFTRLPLGLKNSVAIFQRALDDILRIHIGRICYVYIGNIIVFSEDEDSHLEDLEKVLTSLEQANVLCDEDRCTFMQTRINFLGFVISSAGIETNKMKVNKIANYRQPKTLRILRSFLGLSGYYRHFIEDYAKLAKPLTVLLNRYGGNVSKKMSKNIKINLNRGATRAFNKLKTILTTHKVILKFPEFQKTFDLWTNTSNYAIGAALYQNGQPITFLSRTLSKAEANYSINEKEMLAIVWSLENLYIYLYKYYHSAVKIYTDYDPANLRGNARARKWQSFLENYNYVLFHKNE